ncbi:MAG TPA: zinc-dependent alcohol dehydrogenase family protein [Gemmatimonadaceae bacterium]|nr:zinc-dependent alcohol dehydrogenase family protein [Gemmatimonadaceae bacterium]
MRAMLLEHAGDGAELRKCEIADPIPNDGQLLIRVNACAVCRTDLHILDGELTRPKLPLVLGHEIVGTVVETPGNSRFRAGDRVGVPWLGWTCGECVFCTTGRENLCDRARFTGYDIDGGYAELCVADERFCFPIAGSYDDAHAAPLLCAGLIGFRALRLAGEPSVARRLGIYGFGAAAHLVTQVAVARGQRVFAFTRAGDTTSQEFARSMGAEWAGSTAEIPEPLDAALIFAPAGELVPAALRATAKGGVVVCAGIHMSDIPSFPYEWLWGERMIRSVANLTRRDGDDFLALAPRVPVRTEVERFPLAKANEALAALRGGRVRGAAVLIP